MGAPDILRTLTDAGLRFVVTEGQLLVSPRALLTDDLREIVRDFKSDLIAQLTADRGGSGDFHSRTERHARLIAMGMSDEQADALVERLERRDAEHDDRRLCTECRFLRTKSRTCGRAASAQAPYELGDLVERFQRCPAFQEIDLCNT